ncbi:MAG: PilZ domain-containing protein [bacterium]|nr:PilZ domain-containing protein [bacterium]MDD5353842.1 PilZ domain-containing protein [bacterium]MDD5756714.1 PilZ domain-containing protein [bacterium]
MTNKRNLPRFKARERIGLLSLEDGKLIAEAETIDISIKGISFESNATLDINGKYFIVLGYLRSKKMKVTTQIIAQYFKGTKECYSAVFTENDLLKKNEIRSYVEAVRSGNSW